MPNWPAATARRAKKGRQSASSAKSHLADHRPCELEKRGEDREAVNTVCVIANKLQVARQIPDSLIWAGNTAPRRGMQVAVIGERHTGLPA